jgi:hypothetical protein
LDDLIIGTYDKHLQLNHLSHRRWHHLRWRLSGHYNHSLIRHWQVLEGAWRGFFIDGESNGGDSGYSVSSAGDVNGDGLDATRSV